MNPDELGLGPTLGHESRCSELGLGPTPAPWDMNPDELGLGPTPYPGTCIQMLRVEARAKCNIQMSGAVEGDMFQCVPAL